MELIGVSDLVFSPQVLFSLFCLLTTKINVGLFSLSTFTICVEAYIWSLLHME